MACLLIPARSATEPGEPHPDSETAPPQYAAQ